MKQPLRCALVKSGLFLLVAQMSTAPPTLFAQYTPQYFTSVEQRDRWIADVREAIRQEERELAETERTAAKWLASANRQTNANMRESDLGMYKSWAKLADDGKRRVETLKQKLRNIPAVRDLEGERREQQRVAEQRLASQRRTQEQQQERAREFEAATAKQFQRQQRGEAIGNWLLDSFNRANEQNRTGTFEDFQEAQRERERQWERDYDELERQQAAFEAAEAVARNVQPAPVNQSAFTPPSPVRVIEPEPEPYTPPSLGGYISDDARQFGAEAVVETATILAGQLWEQTKDGDTFSLRNAASAGIDNLAENTFNSIMDETVDSVKDTAYDTFMSLMPQDRQMDIRAMQMPLSFISLRWDNVKDAYFGPHSTWQKDFVEPFNGISSYLWEE